MRREAKKAKSKKSEPEEREEFPFTLLIGLGRAENLLSPMKC